MKRADDCTKGNAMAARLLQDSPGMYPPGSLAWRWATAWQARHGGQQQTATVGDGARGQQLALGFEQGERAEGA
jgi:hypothetical protein